MENKTILYEQHKKKAALLVNFAGWQMPLHYGSQIQELHVFRQNSGVRYLWRKRASLSQLFIS